MCKKKSQAPACNCPPNSPFHWRERTTDTQFVSHLAKSAKSAVSSSRFVNAERERGVDVGHIPSLGDRAGMDRSKPQKFATKKASV